MSVATSAVMSVGTIAIITAGNPSPKVEVWKVTAPVLQASHLRFLWAGSFLIKSLHMTVPTTLFQPFSRLVKITIMGREFEVPENNHLLRCFQYLAPEQVSYDASAGMKIASIAV